jgi:hypothetical protein
MSDAALEDDQERNWRALEAERDEAKAEAAKADELRQEVALLRAGLGDLTEKQIIALKAAHGEADWSKDALLETAGELNLLPPEKPAEEPKPDPVEAQQSRERLSLAADAVDPGALPDKNPARAGIEEFHRLREEEGWTAEEASVQFFDKLLTGVANGDTRNLWDAAAQADHNERARQAR